MEAGQALRAQISYSRKRLEQGIKALELGASMEAALTESDSAERRTKMTDLLAEFEAARHQLRLSVAATGLEEGMTIGAIGRALGISRQLAARIAKEAAART